MEMTERRAVTDRAGLTALFRSESPRIHGLLLARCGNPSIAEELTALRQVRAEAANG